MAKRFVSVWFRHLLTDRISIRQPELKAKPFVLARPERGRMTITAANLLAEKNGISIGMAVADARAVFPSLDVVDETPGMAEKLLRALAEWSMRYTPVAAVDMPEGMMLDVSGCAHLWGGERPYLKAIVTKFREGGYDVRAAIADTAGAAWAVARYGKQTPVIAPGQQLEALQYLPPASLRLEPEITQRLEKLGLYQVRNFMHMPRATLRRRFGTSLLQRLDQALGNEDEVITPVIPAAVYIERLPSFEPIRTAPGIEIALRQLLEQLCRRLEKEGKGLRTAVFKGFRIDNNLQQIVIGTNRPSRNVSHLFKLFELKIPTIEPALGFELFTLEATVTEDMTAAQESLWDLHHEHDDAAVAELLDTIAGKIGAAAIRRYLPDEHYWPERSIKQAVSLLEQPTTVWRTDLPRPIHLLPKPEPIEVTVPIPDYPPMLFHYQGKLHKVCRADGPERIEQEWWLQAGLYRDYYCVEDENGCRYWLFRSGSYDEHEPKWYLHGFFA